VELLGRPEQLKGIRPAKKVKEGFVIAAMDSGKM
jgi:hypothetical protein